MVPASLYTTLSASTTVVDVADVPPSIIFNSAAVDVIAVPPSLKADTSKALVTSVTFALDPPPSAYTILKEPFGTVTLPPEP